MKKLLLIFLVALLGSCNFSGREIITAEKPQIDNIHIATNSVSANLKIDVQSKRKVRISATNLNICDKNGAKIGILRTNDIQINKGTNNLEIPLKVYISTSPLKIMSIIKSGDMDNLLINGSVKVKSGLFGKRIQFDNISIRDFVNGYRPQTSN